MMFTVWGREHINGSAMQPFNNHHIVGASVVSVSSDADDRTVISLIDGRTITCSAGVEEYVKEQLALSLRKVPKFLMAFAYGVSSVFFFVCLLILIANLG